MIGEREIYHGVALSRLVQELNRPVAIESWSTVSRSAYVVDDAVGLYIKYSTKRLAPWAFEFANDHADEIEQLRLVVDDLWIVLVCGPVGIASERWSKVAEVVSRRGGGSFALTVSWRPNHKFRVAGAGTPPILVADNAFPPGLLRS